MTSRRGLAGAVSTAYTRKWTFLLAFLFVFTMSYALLAALGLDPELRRPEVARVAPRLTATALDALPAEAPTRIVFPSLEREVRVVNPTSTNVAILDAALQSGAVRYPTSAKLGEEGNVVIFGHSSYLPVVHNGSYKAFNGIQDLMKGERIRVEGDGHAYVYAVEKVYTANAGADAIPLTSTGRTLTLVTCDSFASKEDRFVVVATLVESYPLAN